MPPSAVTNRGNLEDYYRELTDRYRQINISLYKSDEEYLKESKEILEKYFNENKNDKIAINLKRMLGLVHLELGEYKEAVKDLIYVIDKIERNDGKFDLSMEDIKEDEKTIAEEILEAETYHSLGIAILFGKGMSGSGYPNSDEYLKEAIKRLGRVKSVYADWRFVTFYNDLGWSYYDCGLFEDAIRTYNFVIDVISPPEDQLKYTRFNRGLARYRLNDLQGAKGDLNKALEGYNGTESKDKLIKAAILTNKARIEIDEKRYLDAQTTLEDAKEIYDRLEKDITKKISPREKEKFNDNISAMYINLGLVDYYLDEKDDAEKKFKKAQKYKNNRSARAYNNLANIYLKKDKKDLAERYYKEALSINPELKEAKENLKLTVESKEGVSWWDWWFSGPTWGNIPGMSPKKLSGILLIALFLVSAAIPIASTVLPIYVEEVTVTKTTITGPEASDSIMTNTTTEENISEITANETTRTVTFTDETTKEGPTKTTTRTAKPISSETALLFSALVLFALIHPQIKGFSAGTIKFDLEPAVASKGAATPQCA